MLKTEDNRLTAQRFDNCFHLAELDVLVEETCKIAAKHPKAFYLFMQRYIHFNGQAGSLVARLASSIGLSRQLFIDPNCAVYDESDRGLEVAARILAATVDEHSDGHNKGFAHRTLAQATLRSVGDYAQLTSTERNELGQIPSWLDNLMQDQAEGYQGKLGSLESLIRSMGFHAASETLADQEYTTLDRVVRHENSGTGFDRYLKNGHGQVEVEGKRIGAWYWVAVHGSHTTSGVEQEHFEEALSGINLAMQCLPDTEQEKIFQWVFEGFSQFVAIQQTFFSQVQQECLTLIANCSGDDQQLNLSEEVKQLVLSRR